MTIQMFDHAIPSRSATIEVADRRASYVAPASVYAWPPRSRARRKLLFTTPAKPDLAVPTEDRLERDPSLRSADLGSGHFFKPLSFSNHGMRFGVRTLFEAGRRH
jgi:hypothetical protein